MKVSKAVQICLDYHRNYSKPNTIRAYESILKKFDLNFGDKDLEEISSDDILSFLNKITDGRKQQTKRTRYSHLSAFFNFIGTNIDERIQNPCANRLLKKFYKTNTPVRWDSFEKETIDEIIFRTTKSRNRLILELMARGGMYCWTKGSELNRRFVASIMHFQKLKISYRNRNIDYSYRENHKKSSQVLQCISIEMAMRRQC